MNISDLNNKIYGCKDLKQGENVELIMNTIEEQEMANLNMDNKFKGINKEIKF